MTEHNNQSVFDGERIGIDNVAPPNVITFEADDYKVTKRTATITYTESLFLEQYHTLIFKIDGKEYVFESTDRRERLG